jgi:hypothetical protein
MIQPPMDQPVLCDTSDMRNTSDASDASYVGFAARAQAGGVFSPVWVQNLRARAAAAG